MIMQAVDTSFHSVTLEREDLISFEPLLKDSISRFLTFSSYGLYFPATPPREMHASDRDGEPILRPVFHKAEKKALLPLHRHGELLGIFVARGIPGRITKTALNLWSSLCDQIMDKLLLLKKTRIDERTGLFNNYWLEENLAREIRLVQRGLWPDTPACLEESFEEFSASVGLICLDVDGFARINERFGYQFGDLVLRDLADVLRRIAPRQALCARLREDALAVCLSGATTAKCRHLAQMIAHEVQHLECENSMTGERLRLSISLGFATYPKDFHGRQLRKSLRDQTGLMFEKAHRALRHSRDSGPGRITAFAEILQSSGIVLDVLPMNRILISLGRSVDAQEGQRFLLWSDTEAGKAGLTDAQLDEEGSSNICKGELHLIEVYRETSIAEIILLHDPGFSVQPGDRLSIISHRSRVLDLGDPSRLPGGQAHGPDTGLLGAQAFMKQWSEVRRHSSIFSMMLVHLESFFPETGSKQHVQTEHGIHGLAELAGDIFGSKVVIGRFSFKALAGFAPDMDPKNMAALAETMVHHAQEQLRMSVYVGVAGYPFLTFGKADVLELCRKALEHALMLGHPCAMELCSTSLTISADRFFSTGDIFSAVEEYKLALLADELNHLARNSLGVCFARLGKYSEAQTQFSKILALDPNDIMATYNQGHTFLKQGETSRAEQAFQRCLELDPRHVFSLLRLGQLAEQCGDDVSSHKYFEEAALLPGGKGLTHRHLARLELRRGNTESAREHLHQALVFNARDALALNLLAKMYLEQGEDPEIAESLARQSVALKPEQGMFWEVLADALDALGKGEEAALARERLN